MKDGFIEWGLILFFVGSGGLLQHYVNLPAPEPEGGRPLSRQEQEAQLLQKSVARLRAEYSKLTPEEKQLFHSVMPSGSLDLIANPLISQMMHMKRGGNPAADAEANAERARRLEDSWNRTAAALDSLLWLWLLASVCWATAALKYAKASWLERLDSWSLEAARAWLLAFACLGMGFFALTMRNPWFCAPPGFSLAPLGVVILALGLRLLDHAERPLLEPAVRTLALPAAAFAWSGILGLLWSVMSR